MKNYWGFISLCFLMLFIHLNVVQAASAASSQVVFTVLKNSEDQLSFDAKMVISNIDLQPGSQAQIAFNSIRAIKSLEGSGKLIQLKQGGDFYIIEFTVPEKTKNVSFIIHGEKVVKNKTDSPQGYFLIDRSVKDKIQILPVDAQTLLPQWTPKSGEDEASKKYKKDHTSIEGNPIDTILTPETSLIVPIPVELTRQMGQFNLNETTKIFYEDASSKREGEFFAASIKAATGYQLLLKEYKRDMPLKNAILLTHEGTDKLNNLKNFQQDESYLLEVTPDIIIIHAKKEAGFFYGLQSLRQLLPYQIFSSSLQKNISWVIPSVTIVDYPRFDYRGLHLDSARHFIPKDQVKRLIDLMSIHKLNSLQWHLTDDEGWRIEIKKYPQLTEKGAYRGYDPAHYSEHDLLPAFGSGAQNYGGYYTQDDIRDIVKYAEARHVEIIPEIDMPGHARALIMSLPDQLIDKEDSSTYTSIQGYHDNILNPCQKNTFVIIDDIISEIADLFPGKYIHVGGDEVPLGAWAQSCMAKKYDSQQLEHFRDTVQNDFMRQVQQIIQSKGKIMAGWEEVASESSTLSAPLRAYVWNSKKSDSVYEKSRRNGYQVIMGPAENLYFDLSYNEDPNEPGQYWAGYVDTFSAYSFRPVLPGQSDDVIKGVQGHLWSEIIDSADRLDYLAFPKMAGLAELAWSPASRRNWKNFAARMAVLHLPRLQSYGVLFRKTEFFTHF